MSVGLRAVRWGWRGWCVLGLVAGLAGCGGGGGGGTQLDGTVRSGNAGLANYTVSLYANFVDRADGWQRLARAQAIRMADCTTPQVRTAVDPA